MTALFISYSSVDRRAAERVNSELRSAGFQAVFMDADPRDGILPGQAWEREIYVALRRCDALIFLVSDSSVASHWCFAEVALTRSLGKPILPVRVGGIARLALVADVQEIDLSAGPSAFTQLVAGLRRAGLESEESFPWDQARSPYPGLEAFAAEDAAMFFGRRAEIGRLLELVQPTLARGAGRWVCIIGPSGSGKSSLLHAGLLPRLARVPGRWLVVPPLTPGAQPTRRLAASLSIAFSRHGRGIAVDELERQLVGGETRALLSQVERLREVAGGVRHVLIAIDQSEELITRAGKREQETFLRLLDDSLDVNSPLWVVATMRSEFLSTAPERAGLSEVIDDPLIIEPLSRARLPEVIARPAWSVGRDFEPGLVERMVEDTTGGDALPLLAFTLHELAARTDGTITTEDYEAVGGVVGALRSRADELVDDLTRRNHGPLILPTLLRLANMDEDGVPVRRRLPQTAFTLDERTIVDAFVEARLLTTSGGNDPSKPVGERAVAETATVEVAHEALLRQWAPLREAIESSQAYLRMRTELGREAADWRTGGHDKSYLLRGSRLAAFDELAVAHPDDVEPLEQQFLDASRAAAAEQLQAARRTNRRLRRLSSGLAIVLAIALVAALLAVQQRREANQQAGLAREQAGLALERQLLAQAALVQTGQPEVSLLLGVEALRRAGDSGREEARYALVDGLSRSFHVSTQLTGHTGAVNKVAFDAAGRLLATASDDGTVRLWDAVSGQPRGQLEPESLQAVSMVAFSPDGSTLASVSGSTVQLWDTATRRPKGKPLRGHVGAVFKALYSPDGSILATASADRTVRLWDVSTGRQHAQPLVGHTEGIFDIAFSPDGRTLASAGLDATVRLWDTVTGRAGQVLTGHTQPVVAVAFSPDGSTVVSGSDDTTVRLWDLRHGTAPRVLARHNGEVVAIAISPDGSTVASGSADHVVHLWDAATGETKGQPLIGHTDVIYDLAFTPDGRTLASASNDGTLRLWDASTGEPRGQALTGHTSWINDIAVSPDGRKLASASGDSTARLWDIAETRPLERHLAEDRAPFGAVAISTNGLVASAGSNGKIRLWDLPSGTASGELSGHRGKVKALAFAPDGTLASGGDDETVRLWDPTTRQPIGKPHPTNGSVLDVAFSQDGSFLASAEADGVVQLRGAAGDLLGELSGHRGKVNAVAFGSKGTLASGGDDGTVRLWDPTTRRPIGKPHPTNNDVLDVAFSPDGSRLASAGADAEIRFWAVATGSALENPVTGFTSWVNDIAFSPDGETIASAADEGLQLWDARTGQPRGKQLRGEPFFGVAFGPDGLALASADKNATSLWDLRAESLISQACRIANRNLSRAEWNRFFGADVGYASTCR